MTITLEQVRKSAEPKHLYRKPFQTASEKTIKFLLTFSPDLAKDALHRKFAIHTWTGYFLIDDTTGLPCIGRQFFRSLLGTSSHKFCIEKFLKKHQKLIPGFRWIEYSHPEEGRGKQRRMVDNGLDQLKYDVLYTNHRLEKRICLETLKAVSKKQVRAWCLEFRRCMNDSKWVSESQKEVANYTNTLPYELYSNILEENYDATFALAVEKKDESSLRLLHSLLDMPLSILGLSIKDDEEAMHSSRLFDRDPLQRMPKYLRNPYFKGCVCLDWNNCQLAIAAKVLNIPELEAWLEENLQTGRSTWNELSRFMRIEDKYWYMTKPGMKKALYSIVYGMPKTNVEDDLKAYLEYETDNRKKRYRKNRSKVSTMYELYGMMLPKKKNITDHPLLKAVICAIEKVKAQIIKEGGMMGVNGWVDYEETQEINEFLACIIQGYEFELTKSVYDLAIRQAKREHPDFDVVLNLFDGVIIKVREDKDKEEVVEKVIKEATKKAKEMGVKTRMEEDKEEGQ